MVAVASRGVPHWSGIVWVRVVVVRVKDIIYFVPNTLFINHRPSSKIVI